MKRWYALQTKPRAEYQVADVLQCRDLEIYLPEITSREVGRPSQTKPFFPGYMFLNVDFAEVGISQVQWTPGLVNLVTFDGRPTPVPDQVIDILRNKLDALNDQAGLPLHDFEPGDTVQITDGPLQNMLAIFERSTSSAERVQVLLDFLGQMSRVQVHPNHLKKVAPNNEPPVLKRPRRSRGRNRPIRSTA